MYTTDNQAKFKNQFSAKEKLSAAGDRVVHDLKDLKDDATLLKNDVKEAAHTVSDVARQAGAHVREAAEATVRVPSDFVQSVRDTPMRSAFIALTIGFVLGRLTGK
ncbi:MAG: hypothetical protein M3N08_03640 [Pseudomonadota bacterium]|nr:hypothetical protein [Pseudomonadota bacterium]